MQQKNGRKTRSKSFRQFVKGHKYLNKETSFQNFSRIDENFSLKLKLKNVFLLLTCCIIDFVVLEVCKVCIQITVHRSICHFSVHLTATLTAVETVVGVVDARLAEIGDEIVAVDTSVM